MQLGLIVLHLLLASGITGAILLQPGETGVFGGGGFMSGGEHFHTRRGLEKVVFRATFVLLFAFVLVNLWLIR